MTLSITILSKTTISIMTLNIKILSKTTIGIMTLRIMILSTIIEFCFAECHKLAHNAECLYAKCHYTDSPGAVLLSVIRQSVLMLSALMQSVIMLSVVILNVSWRLQDGH
jgi:hypothetical protein